MKKVLDAMTAVSEGEKEIKEFSELIKDINPDLAKQIQEIPLQIKKVLNTPLSA